MRSRFKSHLRSVRIAAASCLMLIAGAQAFAQGTIRVDCADRFADDLKWKLTEPDKPVYGVKARDWTAEHVREWQRQSLACVNAKAAWSEDAMKAPMRQKINAMATSQDRIRLANPY